ncbi:MAG TPA: glycosyltransferase family 39 protein [Acidimicrobiia bacterium]|jgi:hypothetical protein
MAIACAVVAAPVIAELVRVWRSNFYPTADDAVEAIHARDVFSVHTPLVGMYSTVTDPGRPYLYHLGPMVFWALAIPDRLFSERMGIVIAAAIVNIVAAIALLRSVRRIYGESATLVAAALVAIVCWSLGRNTLAEPWNPYIALIPLMLVLVYSVELANGDLRPLPWAALTGSFVVQAHYIYIPIVLAALAAGIVLGVAARRSARDGASPRSNEHGRGHPVRAAAVVTGVCWVLPLLDVIVHWPGNLTQWFETIEHQQGSQMQLATAWHYVVDAIGWVPLAIRGPLPFAALIALPFHVTTLANSVAIAVVLAVVALTVALWTREPHTARVTAIAGILVAAMLFSVWRLPVAFDVTPTYRILMLWPVGAFVWAAALLGVLTLTRHIAGVHRLRGRVQRKGSVVIALVAILAATVGVFGVDAGRPISHSDWAATRALVGPTLASLPHGHRYLIHSDGGLAYFVQYGIMRSLLDHGYATFMPPNDVQLGRFYASASPRDVVLLVTSSLNPLPRRARPVAQYDPNTPAQWAHMRQTRARALEVLRTEPLRLTPYASRQLRSTRGGIRSALEAVAQGRATPDVLLDNFAPLVFTNLGVPLSRQLFVVGPHIVPTLAAYADARNEIMSTRVRIAVIPPS